VFWKCYCLEVAFFEIVRKNGQMMQLMKNHEAAIVIFLNCDCLLSQHSHCQTAAPSVPPLDGGYSFALVPEGEFTGNVFERCFVCFQLDPSVAVSCRPIQPHKAL